MWTEVILWSTLERMCSHSIMATAKHCTTCLFVLYLYLLFHISGWISSFKNLKDHVYSETNYVNIPAKSFRVEEHFVDIAILGTFVESPFNTDEKSCSYRSTRSHSNISVNCASDVQTLTEKSHEIHVWMITWFI